MIVFPMLGLPIVEPQSVPILDVASGTFAKTELLCFPQNVMTTVNFTGLENSFFFLTPSPIPILKCKNQDASDELFGKRARTE